VPIKLKTNIISPKQKTYILRSIEEVFSFNPIEKIECEGHLSKNSEVNNYERM
jgi:hypothetical protein